MKTNQTITNYLQLSPCCSKCKKMVEVKTTNSENNKVVAIKIPQCQNSACKCHIVFASTGTEQLQQVQSVPVESLSDEKHGTGWEKEFRLLFNTRTEFIDFIRQVRHQAIQETVEKIRTIVVKQRGIGSMTTKGVTDYISRPKLLSELKSIK